jgi:hypothetical protein
VFCLCFLPPSIIAVYLTSIAAQWTTILLGTRIEIHWCHISLCGVVHLYLIRATFQVAVPWRCEDVQCTGLMDAFLSPSHPLKSHITATSSAQSGKHDACASLGPTQYPCSVCVYCMVMRCCIRAVFWIYARLSSALNPAVRPLQHSGSTHAYVCWIGTHFTHIIYMAHVSSWGAICVEGCRHHGRVHASCPLLSPPLRPPQSGVSTHARTHAPIGSAPTYMYTWPTPQCV